MDGLSGTVEASARESRWRRRNAVGASGSALVGFAHAVGLVAHTGMLFGVVLGCGDDALGRRVFLSYSHQDRVWRDAFRQMLGPVLERYGVELWADDHIRSGDRWERVIGNALDGTDLGLLLVTPAYLVSSFSWEVEIPGLLAAQVPVIWVLVEDCLWEDVDTLSQIQSVQDARRDEALADHPRPTRELARLCRKIRDEHLAGLHVPRRAALTTALPIAKDAGAAEIVPANPGEVFGAVPKRPPAFVGRSSDLHDLRTQVVFGLTSTVGVTGMPSPVGLQGRGGIGKTVLAAELTRDPEMLAYFPDGVFWLSLGERPDVLGAQRQLARWLGEDLGIIRSPLQGTKVLRELFAAKQCLLVADDVWSLGVVQALAVTGPKGRLLLTTRDRLLLQRLGATTVELDVLSVAAARQLLSTLTGVTPSELPFEANGVLEATGRVALAVALVGAAIGRGNQEWHDVITRLGEAAEVFAGHAYADTFKALEIATSGLAAEELDRYLALACFPEDTVIPPVTIGRLWEIAEPELSRQLQRFAELGLLRLETGVAFHDLQRDYLLLHAEATALAHEQLLAVHRETLVNDWHQLAPDDPYLWDHLTYHLAATGRHQELIATVTDPAWLAARIVHSGALAAERDVQDAVRWEPTEARSRVLLRRLQQTAHLIVQASGVDSVVATLGTQLWPLRHTLDLARLDRVAPGARLDIAWVADSTSPQLIRTLTGHSRVRSVAWSPDGARLASISNNINDVTVRIWDAATGTQLYTLTMSADFARPETMHPSFARADTMHPSFRRSEVVRTGFARSMAWSPDGTQLTSAGYDETVRVWDAVTGTQLHIMKGHTGRVMSVAWSPDGTRLASAGYDKTVRLWDATIGAPLHTLKGHSGSVESVAWSPDGAQLASIGEDATVRIWDAATGKELHDWASASAATVGVEPTIVPQPFVAFVSRDREDWVKSVAWSPDGTRLASTGDDGVVRIWDVATGTPLHTLIMPLFVRSMAWSPDGTRLASIGDVEVVRIWDAVTGTQLHIMKGDTGFARSMTMPLFVRSMAWSPDGTRLASTGDDEVVRVWDAGTGTQLHTLKGHTRSVESVAWSPDGTRLGSASKDATVRIWDSTAGTEGQLSSGHTGFVRSVAWSPDGTRLASASEDATVRVWDATTGTPLHILKGHTGFVRSVAWSPHGTRLASASEDATVRLWDATTGAQLHTLIGHKDRVRSVVWSLNTRLASASEDATVRVWDATTGTQLHILKGHNGFVRSVAWLADTRLASAGGDGVVRVWDATTGTQLHALEGHTGFVRSVAWSRDGTRLASAGYDKTVRLWDVTTGAPLHTLQGHTGSVELVAWSPDGTRLTSADTDGTVRVWDVITGAPLHILKGHTGRVRSVAWSSDNTALASVGDDGALVLWNTTNGRSTGKIYASQQVLSVDYSTTGGALAIGSDRSVIVYAPK